VKKREKRQQLIMAIVLIMLVALSIYILITESPGKAEAAAVPSEAPIASVQPTVIAASPSMDVSPSPSPSTFVAPPRYGFTEDDIYLLAQLLCGSGKTDGDGEYDIDFKDEINYNEVSKVLAVVMNRVRSDKYPDTVYDVVMQKNPRQFSVMPANAKKIPSEKAIKAVTEWCTAYDAYDYGVQVCPEDHLYFKGNGITNTTY
jgi:hypothetical protein